MKAENNGFWIPSLLLLIVISSIVGLQNEKLKKTSAGKDPSSPEMTRLIEELRTLKRGDLVVMKDESVWAQAVDVPEGSRIVSLSQLDGGRRRETFEECAKLVEKVVRSDDPNWRFVARKFLCGSSSIAQVGSSE